VSPATVSRVLTGTAGVRDETRAKVREAAEELGYVANGLAQAMLGRGRRPLALVTPALHDAAFSELASGAEEVATHNGHLFLMAFTHGDVAREEAIIATLREQRAAGVVLVHAGAPDKEADQRIAGYLHSLASVNATLVLCGHPYLPSLPSVATVNVDQIGGARAAVIHLGAKGHRRIAFLGLTHSSAANQRFLGYSLGLRDAGLTIDSSLVVECPDETVEAHLAALLLLRKPDPPTAIVCFSDIVAVGVYRAARDFHVDIPGQLAVVGFDDSPFAADLTPGLTSIHAPFYDMGARSARLALRLTDDDTHVDLPTELVARDSTG